MCVYSVKKKLTTGLHKLCNPQTDLASLYKTQCSIAEHFELNTERYMCVCGVCVVCVCVWCVCV